MHFTPLLLLLLIPPTTAGQARKPVYDFWDDSPFDDIKWSSYNGITVSQVVVKNREPDQCIHSCIKDAGCVSFFYNRKTKTCEKVPFNFIWPDKVNDSRIEPDRYNRYYRYIPPKEPSMNCPLESCFFYDRVAAACWKVVTGGGKAPNVEYTFDSAESRCQEFSAELASLDTPEKLAQVSLMLINFPVVASPGRPFVRLWVGGRSNRRGIKWINGAILPVTTKIFVRPVTIEFEEKCVVLTGYPQESSSEFRLDTVSCESEFSGMVCERR